MYSQERFHTYYGPAAPETAELRRIPNTELMTVQYSKHAGGVSEREHFQSFNEKLKRRHDVVCGSHVQTRVKREEV